MSNSDTNPKIEKFHIELLRSATAADKLRMLAQLNATARLLALVGIKSRYPQSNEIELQRRLAGLLLGEELACRVYGGIDVAT